MRKKQSLYNIIFSLGSYGTSLLFNFITQAIFIRTLGVEYLGINGLFTNILTMLSVTELGVGTTIIYKLYKPIAEKDEETIKSWMLFYKNCYNAIAIIIFILGICIIPFLEFIVGEVNIKESIVLLYIIQIIDTVFSYCLTYKRSLLYADQKNYIVNFVHIGYVIFMNITQILILYLTKNYIFYLMIKVVYRVLENIIINIIVNNKYSFIKERATKISKDERKDIFNRVKAIFIQKISFVINKGIDNIVISTSLGVIAVGYYTNYFSIISAVCAIIFQIMSSFSASIGNLLVEESKEKIYDVYKKINMINSFLTGASIILVACVIKPFIIIWIGEEYLLSNIVLVSFLLYLYCDSIRRTMTMYKDAAGICIEDKHMYFIMALLNLVSSIFLCKILGISGVILGTVISYLFLIIFSYPRYVFKKVFNISTTEYFKDNIIYLLYIVIGTIICYVICSFIKINSQVVKLFINAIIGITISIILFIIMFARKKEFLDLKSNVSLIINNLYKKII